MLNQVGTNLFSTSFNVIIPSFIFIITNWESVMEPFIDSNPNTATRTHESNFLFSSVNEEVY